MNLNENEQEFYSRQILLSEIGEAGQLKLKAAKVLVIGAGGLGCPVLQYLCSAGVGTVGVVDFDVVELSNLQRQFLYNFDDVGKLKATTAAEHLRKKNPFVKVNSIPELLTVANILSLIGGYDIVVDCSDNFSTRYMVNDACVLLNKTLVYGAVYKFEGQVAVFNQLLNDGNRSATYRCLYPSPSGSDVATSCSDVGVSAVLPGIIGLIQATETIKLITGSGYTLANKLLMVDSKNMNFTTITLKRNGNIVSDIPKSASEFSTTDYDLFCSNDNNIITVSSKELPQYFNQPEIGIIDVRELHETPQIEASNLIRLPINELSNFNPVEANRQKFLVVCASGGRSLLAIKLLKQKFPKLAFLNLNGGLNKWLAADKVDW